MRTDRQRRKPHPKEKAPSLKGNLLTGDRAGIVNLEADLRPGEHKGERGTPGKRAQAAAGRKAEQPTEAPTPAGRKRVGYERPPQTPNKGP